MCFSRLVGGVAVLLRVASADYLCPCGSGTYSIPDDAPCVCCDKGSDGVNNTNVVAKMGTCSANTTVLSLRSNGALTSLPSDVFARFTDLRAVSFYDCGLTALPQELFKFNLELYFVSLKSNNIGNGTLPAELFKFNLELYDVNLSKNNIGNGTLPAELFKFNPELNYVDLFENPFTQVPAGFLANQNNLELWNWPGDAQCSVNQVSNTCEAVNSSVSGTLYYNVELPEPTAEPTEPFEHEQVVCLKEKTKVKCPTGEFFELRAAYFGRSDVADTTCAANYDATPDHTCAASEQLLASSLHEKCNGKRTCKLKSGKKQLKAYGLQKSCNPILQVQYNCIPNAGIVQKKKQVKKARKQAKRTGDWDAFFDMLSAA